MEMLEAVGFPQRGSREWLHMTARRYVRYLEAAALRATSPKGEE